MVKKSTKDTATLSGKTHELPLSTRYSCAWSEINSRLQSRQQVNIYYTAALVASLGIFFTKYGIDDKSLLGFLSIALLLITLATVLWVRHNDGIIGLLGTFCRACEILADPKNVLGLPSWHRSEHGWIEKAYEYRKYTDCALIILVLFSTLPAWTVSLMYFQSHYFKICLFYVIVALVGLGEAIFIYQNHKIRMKIKKGIFECRNGVWKFYL